MVVAGIVVLLIALALVFTFVIWGGTSQTLHRLGIGGGWSDSFVSDLRSQLVAGGGTETEADCFIDELQNTLSQDQVEEAIAADAAGSTPEKADDINEAALECGGDAPF